MPYITQKQRARVDDQINLLLVALKEAAGFEPIDGLANYAVTRIANDLFGHPPYDRMARGVGLLAAAQAEFYRRVVAPYEDTKKEVNGDVYEC